MCVPNHEVRQALNEALVRQWAPVPRGTSVRDIVRAVAYGDSAALRDALMRLFAAIPADWYRKNPIASYEGYYTSIFYSYLAALGLTIQAEDVSNYGRCDLVVWHGSCVWVFEFKVIDGDDPTGTALAQLKAKNYAAKYRTPGVTVLEVGVEFSTTKRQIVGWEVA